MGVRVSAAMGVRVSAATAPEGGKEVIEVWNMNWDAMRVFLAMATQWRVAALTTLERARLVRTGLEYQAIPVVAGMLGVEHTVDLFARLRVLEEEALRTFAGVSG